MVKYEVLFRLHLLTVEFFRPQHKASVDVLHGLGLVCILSVATDRLWRHLQYNTREHVVVVSVSAPGMPADRDTCDVALKLI